MGRRQLSRKQTNVTDAKLPFALLAIQNHRAANSEKKINYVKKLDLSKTIRLVLKQKPTKTKEYEIRIGKTKKR